MSRSTEYKKGTQNFIKDTTTFLRDSLFSLLLSQVKEWDRECMENKLAKLNGEGGLSKKNHVGLALGLTVPSNAINKLS